MEECLEEITTRINNISEKEKPTASDRAALDAILGELEEFATRQDISLRDELKRQDVYQYAIMTDLQLTDFFKTNEGKWAA